MGTDYSNITTTSTTELPSWIQPHYENLANSAFGAATQGYQTYQAPRLQGYQGFVGQQDAANSPELAAQRGFQQMGVGAGPWQQAQGSQALASGIGQAQQQLQGAQGFGQQGYNDMSGIGGEAGALGYSAYGDLANVAGQYGIGASQAGDTAQTYANKFDAQGAASGVTAQTYANKFGAQGAASGVTAQTYANKFGAQGAASGVTAQTYADQFGDIGQEFQDIDTAPQSFLDADMAAYSQPYMTNVTDIAARQAIKFGKQQKSELGSQAASSGAFGGYRHGLQEGNIDQSVRQQVADMRTRGLKDAFDRGIRNFEGDRAAGQTANQQQMAALQGAQGAYGSGLGAQQFGQQFGQGSSQAGLGAQQFGQQFGQGSSQAGLGAQQFGQQFGQGSSQAGLGAQQFGQGFGQQALGGQAGALSQGNQLQSGFLGQQMQGVGQANQFQGQGFQNMMSGIGQMGSMGQGLAGLGAQEQQLAQSRLGQMEASGTRNRALGQAGLDMGYQDFQNQRDYTKNNMSWFGSILGGFTDPGQQQQQTTAQQQPGLFQSMLGTGVAGLGLYNQLQQGGGQG